MEQRNDGFAQRCQQLFDRERAVPVCTSQTVLSRMLQPHQATHHSRRRVPLGRTVGHDQRGDATAHVVFDVANRQSSGEHTERSEMLRERGRRCISTGVHRVHHDRIGRRANGFCARNGLQTSPQAEQRQYVLVCPVFPVVWTESDRQYGQC